MGTSKNLTSTIFTLKFNALYRMFDSSSPRPSFRPQNYQKKTTSQRYHENWHTIRHAILNTYSFDGLLEFLKYELKYLGPLNLSLTIFSRIIDNDFPFSYIF